MATIHDFEQARRDRFTQAPYMAPAMIESVPEDIRDALDSKVAADRRRLLKIAGSLVTSASIPADRELTEPEQPPKFEYPSSEEK